MARRTVYVRDVDEAIWKRAEELAGEESLSGVVTEALRRYVSIKEAEKQGCSRVELLIDEEISAGLQRERKIAFNGKEVYTHTVHYFNDSGDQWPDKFRTITVFLTAKANLLFHLQYVEDHGEGSWTQRIYKVFPSLERAREWGGNPGSTLLGPIEDPIIEGLANALNESLTLELDV